MDKAPRGDKGSGKIMSAWHGRIFENGMQRGAPW